MSYENKEINIETMGQRWISDRETPGYIVRTLPAMAPAQDPTFGGNIRMISINGTRNQPRLPEHGQHNATSLLAIPDTTSRSIKHDGYKAVQAREGQKVHHYFFVLFYCTDVCYRPLGSVNSSM